MARARTSSLKRFSNYHLPGSTAVMALSIVIVVIIGMIGRVKTEKAVAQAATLRSTAKCYHLGRSIQLFIEVLA
jgi:hypothetical protein